MKAEGATGARNSNNKRKGPPKEGGEIPTCKNCGRRHKGECFGKNWKKGDKKRSKATGNDSGFSKKQFNQLKAMVGLLKGGKAEAHAKGWRKAQQQACWHLCCSGRQQREAEGFERPAGLWLLWSNSVKTVHFQRKESETV